MSRLLESFAADEGFQMDGSSFSEEEGDDGHSYTNKSPQRKRRHRVFMQRCLWQQVVSEMSILLFILSTFSCAVPNCVLTKELLTDGLKVLVSKEDELLYAARVHTLDLPDM